MCNVCTEAVGIALKDVTGQASEEYQKDKAKLATEPNTATVFLQPFR